MPQHKRTERIICESNKFHMRVLEKSIKWKNTLRHYFVLCCCLIYLAPVFILLEENCEHLRNKNVLAIIFKWKLTYFQYTFPHSSSIVANLVNTFNDDVFVLLLFCLHFELQIVRVINNKIKTFRLIFFFFCCFPSQAKGRGNNLTFLVALRVCQTDGELYRVLWT